MKKNPQICAFGKKSRFWEHFWEDLSLHSNAFVIQSNRINIQKERNKCYAEKELQRSMRKAICIKI